MLNEFKNRVVAASFALTFFGSGLLHGAGVFIEGANGFLSQDYLAPTEFNLTEGEFLIAGALEGGLAGGGSEQKFFTLNVQEGYEITELNVLSYFSDRPDNSSFLGLQPGSTLSNSPAFIADESNQVPINNILFSNALVDADFSVLSILNVGDPIGGGDTLGTGNYAFWLNETTEGSEWELQFVVEAVPEPSSVSLLALASSFILLRRKRIQ